MEDDSPGELEDLTVWQEDAVEEMEDAGQEDDCAADSWCAIIREGIPRCT